MPDQQPETTDLPSRQVILPKLQAFTGICTVNAEFASEIVARIIVGTNAYYCEVIRINPVRQ